LAAIIIPGQSGTYRYLQGRVTGLLAESGLMIFSDELLAVLRVAITLAARNRT